MTFTPHISSISMRLFVFLLFVLKNDFCLLVNQLAALVSVYLLMIMKDITFFVAIIDKWIIKLVFVILFCLFRGQYLKLWYDVKYLSFQFDLKIKNVMMSCPEILDCSMTFKANSSSRSLWCVSFCANKKEKHTRSLDVILKRN